MITRTTLLLTALLAPAAFADEPAPTPETAPTPAAEAPAAFPWEGKVSNVYSRLYIEPDLVIEEEPCDWRATIGGIFRPLVKDCATAREAVLTIASRMTEVTGVYYSMDRRTPFMNPQEALEEKMVSCSGQTILMVCAFRSIGLPARAIMLPTWNHVDGNHTWPEVWFDGEWHMIEFNEKDFNTPWVMEGVGMLDPVKPEQHIYAVVDFKKQRVLDVTARYRKLAAEWYAQNGVPPDVQRLMVDFQPRSEQEEPVQLVDAEGKVIAESVLPTPQKDMRFFTTFNLPRDGSYTLKLKGVDLPVKATSTPAQVLRLTPQALGLEPEKDAEPEAAPAE